MSDGEGAPAGPLSIQLSCPCCGAPFAVDDEVVSVACDHCGSLLILEAPEREELYRLDGVVAGAADVLEVVILYRVQSQRAEIVGRYRDQDGNPPSEAFVEARLRAYQERLRGVSGVVEAHRLQVPYWHITGKIVQGILGRRGDGPKQVRLRAFAVEHTVAGYDTRKANLRDRGLRLSRARVRPLTALDVRERGPFLPWLEVAERSYREIDKWRTRDLDPEIDPVTKHGAFLLPRRVLVYRPYWLARVFTDAGQEWVLVDSCFGTLAGHPDELEARALLALGIPDPLRSDAPSYRRVQIVTSRCPDCGSGQAFDPRHRISFCSNCHRALQVEPQGIRVVPCSHAGDGAGEHLPFWRYEFRLDLAGSAPLTRLEDYARALFPRGLPPAFDPAGPYLWVPAFRLLGTPAGDRAFQELSEWIHAARLEALAGKVPLGGRPVLWGVSLPEPEARALVPFVLFGLHGRPSAARLNTLLIRRAIEGAKLALSEPTLVLVPFERAGEQLRGRGAAGLPLLLLRGGPQLEAQRATVHASREREE